MCDGVVLCELEPGVRLRIERAPVSATLLHPPGHDYYRILRSKLHWGRGARDGQPPARPSPDRCSRTCRSAISPSSTRPSSNSVGGFTVLTGETGAGKSILVDALLLATGGRADSGAVRHGAERAEVSRDLRPGRATRAARAWLDEQSIDT